MKSFKEIIEGPEISNWTKSERTKDFVAEQIREKYGDSEVANYDPMRNMLSFKKWLSLGYAPRLGERAIKSYVVMEVKDPKGQLVKKVFKKINLFYYRQVQEVGQRKSV